MSFGALQYISPPVVRDEGGSLWLLIFGGGDM